MEKLKIIADSKIPYLKGVLEPFADVSYLDPSQIDREAVKDCDALIVRTRTHCNSELLEGSSVKMIATATIGYDHIDAAYCESKGIVWKNAPGCNAESVAQYILSVMYNWGRANNKLVSDYTIGIVGVGNVGKAVEKVCRAAGMNVFLCDPPRARVEGEAGFVSLSEIGEKCDVITFHTPLTTEGEDKTFHLAGKKFFKDLKCVPLIINSGRGGVIDEEALLEYFDKETLDNFVIDCWEDEPHMKYETFASAWLGTPHIAGYSYDGKANATRMAVENVASFFNIKVDTSGIVPPAPENETIDAGEIFDGLTKPCMVVDGEEFYDYVNHYDGDKATGDLEVLMREIFLRTYDVYNDSNRLTEEPETFEKQRGDYPFRREPKAYKVVGAPDLIREKLEKLGFLIG